MRNEGILNKSRAAWAAHHPRSKDQTGESYVDSRLLEVDIICDSDYPVVMSDMTAMRVRGKIKDRFGDYRVAWDDNFDLLKVNSGKTEFAPKSGLPLLIVLLALKSYYDFHTDAESSASAEPFDGLLLEDEYRSIMPRYGYKVSKNLHDTLKSFAYASDSGTERITYYVCALGGTQPGKKDYHRAWFLNSIPNKNLRFLYEDEREGLTPVKRDIIERLWENGIVKETKLLESVPERTYVIGSLLGGKKLEKGKGIPQKGSEKVSLTWRELYRFALMRSTCFDGPFIELEAESEADIAKLKKEQNGGRKRMQVPFPDLASDSERKATVVRKILSQYKNILLVGVAGAGKTTVANRFIWSHLNLDTQNLDATDNRYGFLINARHLPTDPCICPPEQLLQDSIKKEIESQLNLEDLHRWEYIDEKKLKSTEQIAQEIAATARKDLEKQKFGSNFLIVIDGLNEIRGVHAQSIQLFINHFSKTQAKIVLTSRPWLSIDPPESFRSFNIQSLGEEQIKAYLSSCLPKMGKQIYDNHIASIPRILLLAKNPFFLSLIVQMLFKQGHIQLNPLPAQIIQDFISLVLDRKAGNEKAVIPFIDSGIRDRFLEQLAVRIISRRINRKAAFIRYPHDMEDLPTGNHPLDMLIHSCEVQRLIEVFPTSSTSFCVRFTHDYFLYFYAACHLAHLPPEKLLKDLIDFVEYVEWDIPLCFFLQTREEFVLNEEFIRELLKFDEELSLACAAGANLTANEVKALLPALASVKSNRFFSPIPKEIVVTNWTTIGVLLSKLTPQEAKVYSMQSEEIREAYLVNIPLIWKTNPLEKIKEHFIEEDSRPFTLCFAISQIHSEEALQLLLQMVDASVLSFYPSRFLIDILGRLNWNVSRLWEYATNDNRKQFIATSIARACKPCEEDIPLLKSLLQQEDACVVENAAVLLIDLLGNKALPLIEKPLLKMRQRNHTFFILDHVLGDLGTKESEKLLLKPFADENDLIKEKEGNSICSMRNIGDDILSGGRESLIGIAVSCPSKTILKKMLQRALSFPKLLSPFSFTEKGGVQEATQDSVPIPKDSVHKTLDFLEAWPGQSSPLSCLKEEFSSWESTHRLLAGCLGDQEQRAYIIDTFRKAAKKNWYNHEIIELQNRVVSHKRKMMATLQFLEKCSDHGHNPGRSQLEYIKGIDSTASKKDEVILKEVLSKKFELMLAARASWKLEIVELSDTIHALLESTTANSCLYRECLSSLAGFYKHKELDWILNQLRQYSDRWNWDYKTNTLLIAIEQTPEPCFANTLKKVENEYFELMDDSKAISGPFQLRYLEEGLKKLVESYPDHSATFITMERIKEEYLARKNTKVGERLYEKFRALQTSAGRRFL